MIFQLTKIIREHPEWLRSPAASLSFLKFSTPSSGSGRGTDRDKVIIFVFESGQATPTICAKTVRNYTAGAVIRQNYDNLQLLEAGIKGGEFASPFASPLYLYDDGELIFCVESICPGVRFSVQTRHLDLVVETYRRWQSHLARTAQSFLTTSTLKEFARERIISLKLPPATENVLFDRLQQLPFEADERLPLLVQHGDLTPDNVLVSGTDVCFVDYDYVGASSLAGFDLFQLLSKSKYRPELFRQYRDRHFPTYFESVGATIRSYDTVFFLYQLEECQRKADATALVNIL